MTAHSLIYDFMAAHFRDRGQPTAPLEDIIAEVEREGFTELWEMPREGIINAMRVRGIEIVNGLMQEPEIERENFDPVLTGFAEFTTAATRVLKEANYPIDTVDLISATGLSTTAIPSSTMAHHLRKVGIHYIPGVGYWRSPQYTDPSGRIVTRHCRSERTQALTHYFALHGWPIVGRDAERETGGLVTSRFLTRFAVENGREMIAGLGSGLFVPRDKADDGPLPMSRNVALAMLALEPDTIIDDVEHLRLFRIGMVMERLGMAHVRKSRTTRDRRRRQTMRVTLTDAGRAALEASVGHSRDEF